MQGRDEPAVRSAIGQGDALAPVETSTVTLLTSVMAKDVPDLTSIILLVREVPARMALSGNRAKKPGAGNADRRALAVCY